ncbi:hypothetical protein V6N11_036202 [Hibiscus sabdariffa]|uniref:Uncharacterized protein n=1 Tax=Hibiscus sabdariffa TaxID=183260 RepID=A0ABR2R9P9_9ROSI
MYKEVGLGLIGFGISFTFLGVTLFFDRGLLALGNILWLAGVVVLIGWYSTLQLSRKNYKWLLAFNQCVLLSHSSCWMGYTVSGLGCVLIEPSISMQENRARIIQGWSKHMGTRSAILGIWRQNFKKEEQPRSRGSGSGREGDDEKP